MSVDVRAVPVDRDLGKLKEAAAHGCLGSTYQRNRVLVAVVLCAATQAVDLQWRLIELLSPRDNVVGQVDGDEEPVPF